jgi:chromate transporter
MLAATLGGLLATWCTFVPCFLWIGLGAPWIEKLRENKPLNGALAGITAAVVGVILNLAIWFALHTVFSAVVPVNAFGLSFEAPVLSSVDPWALMLSLGAMIAIFRFNAGMIPTLGACSACCPCLGSFFSSTAIPQICDRFVVSCYCKLVYS